jgi:cytochrome c oxidase subunit 2
MAFLVVAHPPGEFQRWLDQQREPAADPIGAAALRGRDVFLSGPCTMCHTIRCST